VSDSVTPIRGEATREAPPDGDVSLLYPLIGSNSPEHEQTQCERHKSPNRYNATRLPDPFLVSRVLGADTQFAYLASLSWLAGTARLTLAS